MQYLRNTWYVATWGQDLIAGEMVPRTICDQPLVFFRAPDGSPAAILDRCAHRFAPLHMGTRCADTGEITCPYHGLRYGSNGNCVNNPHGSGRIPSALHLASFLHEGILAHAEMIDADVTVEQDDTSLIVRRSSGDVPSPKLMDMMVPQRRRSLRHLGRHPLACAGLSRQQCRHHLAGGTSVRRCTIIGSHLLTPATATTTYYHFAAAYAEVGS